MTNRNAAFPHYILLISISTVTPGARFGSSFFSSNDGEGFWLLGGIRQQLPADVSFIPNLNNGNASVTSTGLYADMWMYSSTIDEWEFIGGPSEPDVAYVIIQRSIII
ncbi:hypothetical protein E6Q11_06005 [Candidatus Dojkabacteria bacterium]|uniref:Uncharacterized protein n=1 Tax=Candidatus Dojkabacteria bacterium TaxID=2099670 RepID=A0A5C7J327_9BACT|nr:MAG: hypothetical protein E6Q11_06005 [Candidatus Dojkabacteria bacterium]